MRRQRHVSRFIYYIIYLFISLTKLCSSFINDQLIYIYIFFNLIRLLLLLLLLLFKIIEIKFFFF